MEGGESAKKGVPMDQDGGIGGCGIEIHDVERRDLLIGLKEKEARLELEITMRNFFNQTKPTIERLIDIKYVAKRASDETRWESRVGFMSLCVSSAPF